MPDRCPGETVSKCAFIKFIKVRTALGIQEQRALEVWRALDMKQTKKMSVWGFPGGPVVKILTFTG